MSNYLFTNAVILTADPNDTTIENGFIAVNGDFIESIGSMKELANANPFLQYEVVDCHDRIIMPGMINTHCHMPMIVFRSLADDVPNRLKGFLFPLENQAMNWEIAVAGSEYAFAELALGGVTTVFDAYFFEADIAEKAAACGIRSILAETIYNFPSPNAEKPYGGIPYAREFLQNWKNHPLVTPAVFCHAIYTNDAPHLQACHALAREHNTLFSMHVAEMDYEIQECQQSHNLTPVAYLEKLDVLDDRFLSAHTVKVTPEDIEILARHHVKVSYNAGSNAKGAKGVAPISAMRQQGITVGLATDGPMSGNTIDVLTQMPLVGKIQKLFQNDRSLFPPREIFRMATIDGAKALGIDHITGSLEVGKKADIVMIETQSVNMSPIYDYYSAIVYSANPANVVMTMVNGKIIMKDRQLLTIDYDKAKQNLSQYRDHIRGIAMKLLNK